MQLLRKFQHAQWLRECKFDRDFVLACVSIRI